MNHRSTNRKSDGPLRIAIQMDPVEQLDPASDSTFRLAAEAQARGAELSYYTPDHLSLSKNEAIAELRPLMFKNKQIVGQSKQAQLHSLSEFDVVLLRQDPPFDMSYISSTYILEHVGDDTLVVNNPFWVRNAPEKLFMLEFADIIPPTLITRNAALAAEFRDTHSSVVIKPLYGNGGSGIFVMPEGDKNFRSVCETFLNVNSEPFVVQKYLPQIADGDKRIILIDGEPIGAINRLPPEDDYRANLHIGGEAELYELDNRDKEICQRIGPSLREKGLIFAGIDIIGGLLTEINVTSPTGILELERLSGINSAAAFWDALPVNI